MSFARNSTSIRNGEIRLQRAMGRWSCYGDQDVELSVHQDQGRMNDVLRPVYTQVFIHSSFAILYLCIFLIS